MLLVIKSKKAVGWAFPAIVSFLIVLFFSILLVGIQGAVSSDDNNNIEQLKNEMYKNDIIMLLKTPLNSIDFKEYETLTFMDFLLYEFSYIKIYSDDIITNENLGGSTKFEKVADLMDFNVRTVCSRYNEEDGSCALKIKFTDIEKNKDTFVYFPLSYYGKDEDDERYGHVNNVRVDETKTLAVVSFLSFDGKIKYDVSIIAQY